MGTLHCVCNFYVNLTLFQKLVYFFKIQHATQDALKWWALNRKTVKAQR